MHYRKSRFAAAIGGVFVAMLTLTALSAQAEDYCDTGTLTGSDWAIVEKKVREKCKIGDIIFIGWAQLIGRLCDLHQPIPNVGNTGAACFLAPPRKTY